MRFLVEFGHIFVTYQMRKNIFLWYVRGMIKKLREKCYILYCAAYQRSAICDEIGESDGCNYLIG